MAKIFEFSDMTVEKMNKMLKEKLLLNGIRYIGKPEDQITKVALCLLYTSVLFAIGIRLYWSRHCSRSLCMSASKRIWECAVYRYRNEWGNRIIQSWQIALLFLCSRSGIGRHEYQFRDAGSRRCY